MQGNGTESKLQKFIDFGVEALVCDIVVTIWLCVALLSFKQAQKNWTQKSFSEEFIIKPKCLYWYEFALLVCTWRPGGHVGGQEQKHFSPLGTKLYFHVNSSMKYSFVLTPNMAALSRGCKPGVELQSTESDQKVILMNFLLQKRELKQTNKQTNKGNKSGDFVYCPISRG